LAIADDPQRLFDALAIVAKWSVQQRKAPSATHDARLLPLQDDISLWMGLLSHLATIDRDFFFLAKRMAAATLVRLDPPPRLYRHMAAALLTSDPPTNGRPTLARDVAVTLGVAVGRQLGWYPTEAVKRNVDSSMLSGCGRMAERIGMAYTAVENTWKVREQRLIQAGFSANAASEFFCLTSLMI
jgi:hypothetical protein